MFYSEQEGTWVQLIDPPAVSINFGTLFVFPGGDLDDVVGCTMVLALIHQAHEIICSRHSFLKSWEPDPMESIPFVTRQTHIIYEHEIDDFKVGISNHISKKLLIYLIACKPPYPSSFFTFFSMAKASPSWQQDESFWMVDLLYFLEISYVNSLI